MVDNFTKYGRSGCSFILNEDKMVLRKISKDVEYNNRLYTQYLKQEKFSPIENFSKPSLFEFNKKNDLHYCEMQYIRGKTFEKFCEESNVDEFIGFCDSLINFLDSNIKNSVVTSINFEILKSKLVTLKNNLADEYQIYIDYLLNNPINELMIGKSHGDLTMSNIIFSDKYYLIDFLDNYFDSPLNDISKIKQDTEYNFYLSLINSNNSKVKICLNYIDDNINKKFKEQIDSFEFRWINILNLLRVVNYLTSNSELDKIKKGLKKYEYIITNSR
jgi:hypothetical protein